MTMRLAMIGLGKMGANMARRLCRKGIEVVGYDRDAATVAGLAAETSMVSAVSVADAVSKLTAPRVVWMMLPSGDPTENQLKELAAMLSPVDVVVDGGNSNYKDSQRRGAWLAELGIEFMDAGTSGGVWGLDNGYCLMVGGSKEVAAIMTPVLQALAPAPDRGWAHVGPVGAGHYSKMLHNGIEYGMMQALAEGLDLLKNKKEFDFDLAQLTEGQFVGSRGLRQAVFFQETGSEVIEEVEGYIGLDRKLRELLRQLQGTQVADHDAVSFEGCIMSQCREELLQFAALTAHGRARRIDDDFGLAFGIGDDVGVVGQ